MAGKVILTAEQIFGHHDISIYLRPTQTSSALGFHSHEFTEIAVLFHGSALYSTQFGSQEIRAGDVLVIPAGDMHSYSEESEVELMNVTFQFDKLPVPYRELIRHPGFAALFMKKSEYYRMLHSYPQLHLNPAELEQVHHLLYNAWLAQQKQAPAYGLTVFGAFLQFIPILLEAYGAEIRKREECISPGLKNCLTFITENYTKNLSLKQLAKRACMSETSFLRHFKSVTGRSPLNYIILLRLRDAAEKLVSTDQSVTDIALEAGFKDSNYFSRCFSKYMQQTPMEFRLSQSSGTCDGIL